MVRRDRCRPAAIRHHELGDLSVHGMLDHGRRGAGLGGLTYEVVRVGGRALPGQEEVARTDLSRILAHARNGDVPRAARLREEASRPEDFAHRVQGHRSFSHRAPAAHAAGSCPLAGPSALPPAQFL